MSDLGRYSDGGVLTNASFHGHALVNGTLTLPQDCSLPGTTGPNMPYVIVGDEAINFPLNKH